MGPSPRRDVQRPLTEKQDVRVTSIPQHMMLRKALGLGIYARVEYEHRHLYPVHNATVGVTDEEVRTVGTCAALEGDARHMRAAGREEEVLIPLHSSTHCRCQVRAPEFKCIQHGMPDLRGARQSNQCAAECIPPDRMRRATAG